MSNYVILKKPNRIRLRRRNRRVLFFWSRWELVTSRLGTIWGPKWKRLPSLLLLGECVPQLMEREKKGDEEVKIVSFPSKTRLPHSFCPFYCGNSASNDDAGGGTVGAEKQRLGERGGGELQANRIKSCVFDILQKKKNAPFF